MKGFNDGLGDFVGCGGLEQIAAGSRADGMADLGFILKDGEDDNPAVGSLVMNVAKNFKAAAARQPHIKEHHLRFFITLHEGGEHGFSVGKGARRSESALRCAEALKAAAESIVIFDEPDADKIGIGHAGRVRVMRVP